MRYDLLNFVGFNSRNYQFSKSPFSSKIAKEGAVDKSKTQLKTFWFTGNIFWSNYEVSARHATL